MQTALTYRTNRDLFSNYYLDEHLPETEAWDEVSDEVLRAKREEIRELWDREKGTVADRTESGLEEKFIRPMFRLLGIPFEVEETVQRGQRRPDYGFFPSDEAARKAFDHKKDGGDFYAEATAVADAKRWGRPLDTRGSGEHKRDFENPSYQIHVYLQEVDAAQWAVLTNGQKWRLYYGPTSHRLDSYYEVDLPTILEDGNLEDFKYFYLFFRQEAFLEDAGGDSFLDDVYGESNVFAQELGEDLQDNIYEAIKILSEGYLQYSGNDLDEGDLDLIHDSSLIYLYRLIFVLYAEAEGRQLLDTDNEIYEEQYSLNALKQEVAAELDSADPKYRDWQDNLSSRLDELFSLIDQGSKSQGIPEADLYIPAYNGGLFRTDPDEDDSKEARFLANHTVGDAYLARVVELLTRSRNGGGKIFVDYSSLDVRHLGSIYEGLLEYQLHVADEDLTLADGEYVPAAESDEVVVDEGEVYLTTGSGERKATGSYYTPEYVVEYIVDETLGPLVADIREDLVGYESYNEGGFAEEFAERVFELKILDPAMGSGHFLTSAVDYLAREIIDAQERQAEQQGIETIDEGRDINWARRKVAQRCIYGVDLNPLATELAKVSLWLRTLAAEQPLAFLDHHLKTGNSLVGSDIEDVLANGEDGGTAESGQLTLQQSFDRTRQQAIEHVMDRFQDLLSIDNETLEDAKEMEDVYDEVRDDPLYRHLLAMANVHTAEQFGLDVPSDAHERMARALKSESWETIEGQDWFADAQALATDERFFHWELEFPVAFYDEDGDRKADAGFDAVIGNPPWGHPGENKDYLKTKYSDVVKRLPDMFSYFSYKSLRICKNSVNYGMILPSVVLFQSEYSKLRKELLDSGLLKVADLGEGVFPDAVAPSAILICDLKNSREVVSIQNLRNSDIEQLQNHRNETNDFPIDLIMEEENLVIPTYQIETRKILSKLQQQFGKLGQQFAIEQGIQTGGDEAFTVSEPEIDEFRLEQEFIYPVLFGSDVTPFAVSKSDQYILYIGRNVNEDQIPNICDYLRQFKDSLESVSEVKKGIRPWYTLHRPRKQEIFEQEKIVLRQTGDTLIAAVERDSIYTVDSLLCVTPTGDFTTLEIVNILLNSTLLRALYDSITQEKGRVFSQVKPQNVSKLPFPSYEIIESSIKNMAIETKGLDVNSDDGNPIKILIDIHNSREELGSNRSSLNLSLLDYLGNYTDGSDLPDIGLFQPTGETILDATTEDYAKLKIGRVRTTRENSTVTIEATARYKPDDEDAFETDTYGYTETEFVEAFALTDLSANEAALVEAFVPVAVDDEIAGFRDNATKTNSLVDRLKAITLPDPDDVADDLQRYVETRDRAEELDAKIEKTDRLIDEIVYDLYDLSDDEIEIVEEAVGE